MRKKLKMNKNQMIEKINAAKEAYYGNGRIDNRVSKCK